VIWGLLRAIVLRNESQVSEDELYIL